MRLLQIYAKILVGPAIASKKPGQSLPRIIFYFFLFIFLAPMKLQASPKLLTSTAEIRSLSTAQASQEYPVRLQGVVTFFLPKNLGMFFQDSSSGIYVMLDRPFSGIHAGQRVEITGVTAPGDFQPIVRGQQIKVLNAVEAFPTPLKKLLSERDFLKEDCQWIETEGVVRSAVWESPHGVLELSDGKNRLKVLVLDYPEAGWMPLVDSRVRVRGAAAIVSNYKRQAVKLELFVPRKSELIIETSAVTDPYSLPLTTVKSLESPVTHVPPANRVKVEGVVMATPMMAKLLLRDSTGIVEFRLNQPEPIYPGDFLRVVGFVAAEGGAVRLEDSIFQRLESQATFHKQEQSLPLLQTVAAVWRLDARECSRGYPLRIRGVFTYYDPASFYCFVADGTGSIFVELNAPLGRNVVGESVEISGFSAPGDLNPIIVNPKIRMLGRSGMPPALSVSIDRLATGELDAQLVEMRGIVRSSRQSLGQVIYEVSDQGKRVQVVLPKAWIKETPPELVDALVRVRGVCGMQLNQHQQIVGFQIFVSSLDGILVNKQPTQLSFAPPPVPIRDMVREFTRSSGHRVKIQGAVLMAQPGRGFYLKDKTGVAFVQSRQVSAERSGLNVMAAGYPTYTPTGMVLEDAIFQWAGGITPPDSLVARVSVEDLLQGSYSLELVRIQGRLLDQLRSANGQTLILQAGKTVVTGMLEDNPLNPPLDEYPNDSLLEVAGLCQMEQKPGEETRIRLLLRTAADVKIIQRPSWWTRERIINGSGILLVAILASASWVAMLKRRVNRQTIAIRQHFEQETLLEKKYRDLFDNSNDLVFACDLDGRITTINPAAERVTGYSREDLSKKDFKIPLVQAAYDSAVKWFSQKLEGTVASPLEIELKDKRGNPLFLEINAELVTEKGQPVGFQGIGRDITERKLADATLRESEEKLRQAQKLEAIGTLAGGIAHDFNNILAAILGYAELSLDSVTPGDPVHLNQEEILKAARRARDLVRQILAFSRKLQQERRPIQLEPVIREAMQLMRATLPATIEIQMAFDPGCPPVMADPTQIHQVVVNLVTNAYQAMRPQGGLIGIHLDSVFMEEQPDSILNDLTPGQYSRLSISDTGDGIPANLLERIFDPYFTTKPVGEGSGLGLAVVHGIVRGHGGAITVESTPGKGSLFQIYLPECEPEWVEPAVPSGQVPKGKGQILFVDDESSIVSLNQKTLEWLGYTVTGKTSSQEALEEFRLHPLQYDLIITDYTMPQFTGWALAEEIWKIKPDQAMILCTGFTEDMNEDKALHSGFKALLHKPASRRDLAFAIQKALLPSLA